MRLPLFDFDEVLAGLKLPVFVVGSDQIVRWMNPAATAIVGDLVGRRFLEAVAPESQATVRDAFAKKLVGTSSSTEYDATFTARDGSLVRAEVSSVRVGDDGHLVAVFGVAVPERDMPPRRAPGRQLTPRQAEVLRLLARGGSTGQIADELGVSPQTARNHVRDLMRRLDVHSRIEAVAAAHRRGLV